jgi:hypothetical protein
MKIAGDYILIESIDDLKNRIAWDKEKDIFVNSLGVFHDISSISYPHVFERVAGYDMSPANHYVPVPKDEMIRAVQKKIERWMSDMASAGSLLKTLEDM